MSGVDVALINLCGVESAHEHDLDERASSISQVREIEQ